MVRLLDVIVFMFVALSILLVFIALFVPPLFEKVPGIGIPRFLLISVILVAVAAFLVLGGLFAKIPMRIRTIRITVQGIVIYAINATAIGSLYIAPFLPTLRFRHMAGGEFGVPLCSVGSIARCFSENWRETIGPAIGVILMFIALLVVVLFIGILIGRAMCGWACPIGCIQDMFIRLRSGLKIGPKEFSPRTHDILSLVKYGLLFFFLLLSLTIGIELLAHPEAGALYQSQYGDLPLLSSGATVCEFCPAPITAYFTPTVINNVLVGQFSWSVENSVRLFMFFAVWIGAFFIMRWFCRYLCWMGALISPLNRVSILTLYKNQKKCTKCNFCVDACPMRVRELRDEDVKDKIDHMGCTYCFECIDFCPEKALEARIGNWTIYRGGKDWWKKRLV